jgi:hypothetical protein
MANLMIENTHFPGTTGITAKYKELTKLLKLLSMRLQQIVSIKPNSVEIT